MLRVILPTLLLVLVRPALAEGPTAAEVDALIARLGADSVEERTQAGQELVKLGSAVLPRLREAMATATDPEVEERLKEVIAEIGEQRRADRAEGADREREANLAAYKELREELRAKHKDRWVVIAGGKLAASADSLEAVLEAATASTDEAAHRYVFQVGHEPELEVGPEAHGSLRAGDIGMGLQLPFAMVAAGGETQIVGPDGKLMPMPKVQYSSLDGEVEPIEVDLFWNTGFAGQTCLDPERAARLDLQRYEIPGTITGATITPMARGDVPLDYPARRAWVRVTFPGTDVTKLIEATIPRELPR